MRGPERYDEIMAKGREVADAVKANRHDQELFAFAKDLSDNVTCGLSHDDLAASGPGSKSRRLPFKGMGAGVARQMVPDCMKALVPSGGAVVDTVDTNVVKLFGYSLSPTGMNEATTSSINRSARLLLISATYDRAVSVS